MIILGLYLIEGLIISLWWKLILKVYLPDFSIRRVYNAIFFKANNKKDNSIRTRDLLRIIKRRYILHYLKELLLSLPVIMLLSSTLLIPLYSVTIIKSATDHITRIMMVGASFVLLVIYLNASFPVLKRNFKEILKTMNSQNISKKDDDFERIENLKKVFGHLRKNILFLLIVVTCGLFFIFWFKGLVNSIASLDGVIKNIFGVGILVFVLIKEKYLRIREKKKKFKEEKKTLLFQGIPLEPVEQELRQICNLVGIKNLKVEVKDSASEACAIVQKFEKPIIIFSERFCALLIEIAKNDVDLYKEYMKFVFSHELIHIKYEDPIKMEKRCLYANIVMLVVLFLSQYLIFKVAVFIPLPLFTLLFLVLSVFLLFVWQIIRDIRYWEQIAELRSDKLGLYISGVSKDVVISLWKNGQKKIEKEKKESQNIDKQNLVYRYFARNIDDFAHPNWECRIKNIENESSWGIRNYVEHIYVIYSWRKEKKGWSGF